MRVEVTDNSDPRKTWCREGGGLELGMRVEVTDLIVRFLRKRKIRTPEKPGAGKVAVC